MRRTSNILFLVSKILSIVFICIFLLLGIMFVVFAANEELINEVARNTTTTTNIDPKDVVRAVFITYAVVMLVVGALAIPNLILCSKARNNPTKGLLIANIVFGLLSGVEVNIVAAILGLIANARNQ